MILLIPNIAMALTLAANLVNIDGKKYVNRGKTIPCGWEHYR